MLFCRLTNYVRSFSFSPSPVIKSDVLVTVHVSPPSFSLLQAVPGGEGPLLRLGLPAAPVHHPGGELQHEPVEAEHHRLPGEERGHTTLALAGALGGSFHFHLCGPTSIFRDRQLVMTSQGSVFFAREQFG